MFKIELRSYQDLAFLHDALVDEANNGGAELESLRAAWGHARHTPSEPAGLVIAYHAYVDKLDKLYRARSVLSAVERALAEAAR